MLGSWSSNQPPQPRLTHRPLRLRHASVISAPETSSSARTTRLARSSRSRSGLVRLFKKFTQGGEQAVTRFIRPGEYFGESAFAGGPRGVTAEAMEETALREHDAVELESQPSLATAVVGSLSRRLAEMLSERSGVKGSLFTKLATKILELAERDGEKIHGGLLIPTRITHEMLAGLIGARRETVTIHLSRLRKLRAIEQRDTGLFVNPDNLSTTGGIMRHTTESRII